MLLLSNNVSGSLLKEWLWYPCQVCYFGTGYAKLDLVIWLCENVGRQVRPFSFKFLCSRSTSLLKVPLFRLCPLNIIRDYTKSLASLHYVVMI